MTKLDRSAFHLVERFLAAFPQAESTDHALIAVSGGSDSLALLELMHDTRCLKGFDHAPCTAVYIDHGQRSETRQESEIVRAAARKLGAGFETAAIDQPHRSSEGDLRAQRYGKLGAIADRIGADWILTGHTRDDQIETVVMRLVRGAGRLGLAGIRRRRDRIVRPLLDITRRELRDYLDSRGIEWSDDPSNDSDAYTRNRLRNDVIPTILEAFGPTSLEHLPDVASRLAVEDAFLEAEAGRYQGLVVVGQGDCVDLTALAEVPEALRPRLLRAWLGRLSGGAMISMSQLAEVEKLARSHAGSARIEVAGLQLERRYDRVTRISPQNECYAQPFLYKVDATKSCRFVGPHGAWEIRIDPNPTGPLPLARGAHSESLDFDPSVLGDEAVFRPLAQGDRIELARHGMRKVRDIMADRHLALALRSEWPVLATERGVLWVPGLAVARNAVPADRDASRVRLDWKGLHI
jgi:tRNA(Ile)-lysidine synthase